METVENKLREIVAAAYRAGNKLDLSDCHYGATERGTIAEPMKYYAFLAGLAFLSEAKCIVEIGTHYGGSTRALKAGLAAGGADSGKKPIVTVDTVDFVGAPFRTDPAITAIIGDIRSPETISDVKRNIDERRIDILFVDALKDGAFVQGVLDAFASHEVGWIVLDDIAPNDSMRRKWSALKIRDGVVRGLDIAGVIDGLRERQFGMGVLAQSDAALENAHAKARGINGPIAFSSILVGKPYNYHYGKFAREEIPPPPPPAPTLLDRLKSIVRKPTPRPALPRQFRNIGKPRYMMRPAELGLLHRLAATAYRGDGEIVDAGTFLGASGLALGMGLSRRTDAALHLKRIHSYDLFVNTGRNFDAFLDDTHPRRSSFLDICLANTQRVSRFINTYAGDFTRSRWIGKPIEIFFCDIAKSPALNAHVYQEFEPFWIPGATLYVQQDFVHMEAPWIQWALGSIIECFTVIGVEPPSLLLGYNRPIPREKLKRIAADDFTVVEKAANLDRLALAVDHAETQGTMGLIKARVFLEAGQLADAQAALQAVVAQFGAIDNKDYQRRIRKVQALLKGDQAVARE